MLIDIAKQVRGKAVQPLQLYLIAEFLRLLQRKAILSQMLENLINVEDCSGLIQSMNRASVDDENSCGIYDISVMDTLRPACILGLTKLQPLNIEITWNWPLPSNQVTR